jgi:hypothetical protein
MGEKMNYFQWAESRIRKMHWYDISLTKLSVAAFILMLAKLWQPILNLEWYWYGIIFLIAAIRPLYTIFSGGEKTW